jgi:hypothetical protein
LRLRAHKFSWEIGLVLIWIFTCNNWCQYSNSKEENHFSSPWTYYYVN